MREGKCECSDILNEKVENTTPFHFVRERLKQLHWFEQVGKKGAREGRQQRVNHGGLGPAPQMFDFLSVSCIEHSQV